MNLEKPLPPSFFLKPPSETARDLLGKGLVVGTLHLELVEVEAYLGSDDPASHAFRGPTKRNWPMFESGGTCYVYLCYGMHFCMNVSVGEKGKGGAILFRAGQPLEGHAMMQKNRGLMKNQFSLTNGPGKLTQALGVDMAFNGLRFDREDFKLVDLGKKKVPVGKSPRIGISEARDSLLRFYIKDSPWVSRAKP